jgi:hypothetical protein
MFRETGRQLGLLGAQTGLSEGARKRLLGTWAEGFRQRVMPELLDAEGEFARLYAREGRPNWSVARLVGLSLLQQLQDMSDQEVLDALSFDLRFQHALDVDSETSYLSRRSLVEFRRRLVEHDPDGTLLRGVFDRICAAGVSELGLSTAEQRLDSTLIVSNIRTRGRLSLARETLRMFLRSLSDAQNAFVPDAVRQWYETTQRVHWDPEVKAGDKQARLHEMGRLVADTLEAFARDEVTADEPYRLLRRLADEHGEALGIAPTKPPDSGGHDDDDSGNDDSQASSLETPDAPKGRKSRVISRQARYWSTSDPDASCGHKGLGYHAHFTETCRNESTELLTDYAVLTAAQPDIGQAMPILQRLAERGLRPQVLYADGGYPTPNDLMVAPQMGTELWAPVNRGRLAKDSFSRSDFVTNVEQQTVIQCPAGHAPSRHAERESSDSIHPRRAMFAFFPAQICSPCPQRDRCPVRQPNNKRSHEYRLELSAELMARDARWAAQKTDAWKTLYRIRAGSEATMSEVKRGHGAGRLRVRRMAQVLLQIAFKATACNVKRWLRACAAALRALLTAYTTRYRLCAPSTVQSAHSLQLLRAA